MKENLFKKFDLFLNYNFTVETMRCEQKLLNCNLDIKVAVWYKLRPKQWRTVGVALTFYNFDSSKKYLEYWRLVPELNKSHASALSLRVTDLVSKLFASGMSLGL